MVRLPPGGQNSDQSLGGRSRFCSSYCLIENNSELEKERQKVISSQKLLTLMYRISVSSILTDQMETGNLKKIRCTFQKLRTKNLLMHFLCMKAASISSSSQQQKSILLSRSIISSPDILAVPHPIIGNSCLLRRIQHIKSLIQKLRIHSLLCNHEP